MAKLETGQKFSFTKDLGGVCQIKEGDKAVYLGNNQAKILTGESKDWLVYLTISAPILATPK